ncbi:MAG: hypothetical protein AB1679_10735 [Actinomycetota bacterium]
MTTRPDPLRSELERLRGTLNEIRPLLEELTADTANKAEAATEFAHSLREFRAEIGDRHT